MTHAKITERIVEMVYPNGGTDGQRNVIRAILRGLERVSYDILSADPNEDSPLEVMLNNVTEKVLKNRKKA